MTNKGVSQNSLNGVDSEISELITKDLERQNTHIHLIASENFASKAVMEASGSILTNKSVSYTHLTLPTKVSV